MSSWLQAHKGIIDWDRIHKDSCVIFLENDWAGPQMMVIARWQLTMSWWWQWFIVIIHFQPSPSPIFIIMIIILLWVLLRKISGCGFLFVIFCQTEAAGVSQDHLLRLHPLIILLGQGHMWEVIPNLGKSYFQSFLKADSPRGYIVTLHWLHDTSVRDS